MLGLWTPSFSTPSKPAEKTRDEVLAYAKRLDAAWSSFYSTDFKPWASGGMTKEGILTGEVLGTPGSDPKKLIDAKAKVALVDRIANDRQANQAYHQSLGIGGPSWPDAWNGLLEQEATLKADRKALSEYVSLRSEDPGNIADPRAWSGKEIALYTAGGVTVAAVVYGLFRWIKSRTGGGLQ